jgi:RNA polymerase subunit RPABC4/transcription elongation factor Spt4
MRCNNCGWDNPESRSNCEKCNSALSHYSKPKRQPAADPSLRKTENQANVENVRYVGAQTIYDYNACPECSYPLLPDISVCPNCGHNTGKDNAVREANICTKCNHPYQEGAYFCSQCGYEVQKGSKLLSDRKTITPWDLPPANSCRIKLIPNDNENIPPSVLTFSGDSISLNRSNTDVNNITITSKEQAVLIYENNKWYIQDKSEQRTTFIHTKERVELKQGDIIMLGNRRFEFEG